MVAAAAAALAAQAAPAQAAPAQAAPAQAAPAKAPRAFVAATADAPGYEVEIAANPVRIVTKRGGKTVLAMAPGADGGFRFRAAGQWHYGTTLTSTTHKYKELRFTAATSLAGHTIEGRIALKSDRYAVTWQVKGASAGTVDEVNMAFDLASAGHWYGHGEIVGQPYPLETGRIHHREHSPASYDMVEPFWYTSSATGLWVDTGKIMDVDINSGGDGLAYFAIKDGGPYNATVFVEETAKQVNRDWIGVVGKPAKSDATYEQFAKPLWNSWAQYYTKVDQKKLLEYAQGLHKNGLGGHTIQLDDKWESNYGNMTFDPKTFPNPRALSDSIHDLGFDFGIWVTLWINHDSVNYKYAADRGWLLADGKDPSKPCVVEWWNSKTAGVIDIAKPAARAWYEGNLRKLMKDYRIDGFKFDTRFFDDKCSPAAGHQPKDYQRLGADLADQFDLQGAGIRAHWVGPQTRGFVTRTVDQGTGWKDIGATIRQALTVSTLGYPFVETDMIGGSCQQPPPAKEVLVRWAQAAAFTPLMYSSTSPLGVQDIKSGKWTRYDKETIDEYRRAINAHERLAPYIWDQVQVTLKNGDPIMRPLFFDFPGDERLPTIHDEWMLGPAVLAAPMMQPGDHRNVVLPAGKWLDVNQGTTIQGPTTLTGYPVPLGVTPAFVKLGAPGAAKAIAALRRTDVPAAGVRVDPGTVETAGGKPAEVAIKLTNWKKKPYTDANVRLKVPAGWTAEAVTGAHFDEVKHGETVTTTWRVTPPVNTPWGPQQFTAIANYVKGNGAKRVEASGAGTLRVLPTPDDDSVTAPFKTHSSTPAADKSEYARSGDQFAIWAGGRDFSGWVDERATIYRDAPATSTVVARVVDQRGGGQIAKAGIAVANDLTAPAKGGFAMLVMTANNGIEFLFDRDGDGKLDSDTWAGGGSSVHPVWLKLVRAGTAYTAYRSDDGATWSEIAKATVASASGAGQAGMVASAVNLNDPGKRVTAVFDNFAVTQ